MTQAKTKSEPKIDEEVEASFPASDPPSSMGSTAVAGAPKGHPHAGPEGGAQSVKQEEISIDLNRATKEELGSLPALGPDLVSAIMASRPFTSWEALKDVPGFDGETIAALKKGGAHING